MSELSLLASIWTVDCMHWPAWIANWDWSHILAFLWVISLFSIFYLWSLSSLFLGFLCCIICQLNKRIVITLSLNSWSLISCSLHSILDACLGLVHTIAFLVLLKIVGLVHVLNGLANHSSYYSLIFLFYVIYVNIAL